MEVPRRSAVAHTSCPGGQPPSRGPFPAPIAALLGPLAPHVGAAPDNCLANLYPDGDSTMGFHSDAVDLLAPRTRIAILSLGAERALTFRAKADPARRVEVPLPAGSVLSMSQETQAHWTHAIRRCAGAEPRISLTFRRSGA